MENADGVRIQLLWDVIGKTKVYINCQKTRIFTLQTVLGTLPMKILQRNYTYVHPQNNDPNEYENVNHLQDRQEARFFISSILGERSDKRSFELSIQYTTQGSKKNYFLLPTPLYPTSMLLDNGAYVSTRGTGRKYAIINKKDFNRKD